jgi:hypothetical protein
MQDGQVRMHANQQKTNVIPENILVTGKKKMFAKEGPKTLSK